MNLKIIEIILYMEWRYSYGLQISGEQVCQAVGGRENIVSAAHCATRLRLVIGDDKK